MRDVKGFAQLQMQKNFKKFGTARRLCTYDSMSKADYDPDTGNTTNAADDSDATGTIGNSHEVLAILDGFSMTNSSAPNRRLKTEFIIGTDQIMIFPYLDLPFVAEVGDEVTDDHGTRHEVIGFIPDPFLMVYEIHIRSIL